MVFCSVTIADSSSAVSAADAFRACRLTIASSRLWPSNGPVRAVAALMTSTDTSSTQGAAPASWKRSAAQTITGKTRKSNDSSLRVAMTATATVATSRAAASAHRYPGTPRGHRIVRQTRMSGVMTRMPIASPTHQATQVRQKPPPGRAPLRYSIPVPSVALISIPAKAPRATSATPSRSRSSAVRKPTRRSIQKAHTGARVLPAMIPRTETSSGLIVATTARVPRAMPGQVRRPRRSRQLREMPVGGHSGVTTAPEMTTCSSRPIRADA